MSNPEGYAIVDVDEDVSWDWVKHGSELMNS